MSKFVLNEFAVSTAKQEFRKWGFKVENSSLPSSEVDFEASLGNSNINLRIKVRAISQIGSYIFSLKKKFNIEDPNLYMAVVYLPNNNEKELYLIPAGEWGKNIYPFKGKDYNKPGQVSEPEWGISFSRKAKDAMEPYRFASIIKNFI